MGEISADQGKNGAPTTPERQDVADEAALIAHLQALGIPVIRHAHPPLHTVEESRRLRGALPGGHTKNLFLKDDKGKLWLIVAEEDRRVDLKTVHKRIGAGRLSFGKPPLLWEALGVRPGAVTALALINDKNARVQVVIDAGLLAHEEVNAHPLHNEATLTLKSADLLKFIAACGHDPQIVDLDNAGAGLA